jgi:hypothetical protein
MAVGIVCQATNMLSGTAAAGGCTARQCVWESRWSRVDSETDKGTRRSSRLQVDLRVVTFAKERKEEPDANTAQPPCGLAAGSLSASIVRYWRGGCTVAVLRRRSVRPGRVDDGGPHASDRKHANFAKEQKEAECHYRTVSSRGARSVACVWVVAVGGAGAEERSLEQFALAPLSVAAYVWPFLSAPPISGCDNIVLN